MEQSLQQIAQRIRLIAEHHLDPPGIFLEARHILPRKIEHPRRARLVIAGDLEHLAERRNLVSGHQAVGLGHLRAQRDHRDRKGHAALGRGAQFVEYGRQALALGKGGNRLGDACPK